MVPQFDANTISYYKRRTADWADDIDDDPAALPPPSVSKNPDGTETHITFRWREDGKKVKTTRIIKKSVLAHKVNPRIAERRGWAKFGDAAKDAAGPQSDTTTVGEDIVLNLKQGFKAQERDEAQGGGQGPMSEIEKKRQELQKTTVKCRICNGEHFTARCPFKGTMAPEGEPPAGEPVANPLAEAKGGEGKGGKYVAPGKRGEGTGERMAGKYERDDLATLRVTNVSYFDPLTPHISTEFHVTNALRQVSEYAEEQEMRDMFERWGRVTRVFLAKDRETGRAKGFAFVSFGDRDDAAKACARMDGYGYNNLILRVEFAKKTT